MTASITGTLPYITIYNVYITDCNACN